MTLSAPPHSQRPLQAGDLGAALDWWRDAGVDHDFSDAARDWLEGAQAAVTAAPQPIAVQDFVPPPPPPAPRIGGASADWPQDLAAFSAWWLNEPSLDGGQTGGRVPPRGPVQADLMVIAEHPEAGDSDSLLAGEQGRMLAAILSALEIPPDAVYVASLLPRHTPMPDWPALQASGLGELALHHAALVAPRRVITFGTNVSSLLGHDPAKSAEPFPQFYRLGPSIPALAAPGLNSLLARPRGKAALWRSLLDWQVA
ncbi:MAG: hypothetical protein ACKOPG_12470 [Novosphingobium sp.]